MIDREPSPDEAAGVAETLEWLDQSLSVREQEIFSLRLHDGLTTTQIAAQLEVSRWTVRRHLDHIGELLEKRRADTECDDAAGFT